MRKSTMFGILAVLIIGIVGAGLVNAFGYGQKSGRNGMMENDAVTAAIEAGDYDAWKAAMIEGLTEDVFNDMVERHNSMQSSRQSGEFGKGRQNITRPEGWEPGDGFGEGLKGMRGKGFQGHEGCPFTK
ncbi:MAG: hypothetical protein V1729_06910 [Candidatus Woesearchaeota archaeon]